MGWMNCGTDSEGRLIGYGHEGTCDHLGCDAEIDRGLSYACGGMHGEDGVSCEKYFCLHHLVVVEVDGRTISVCQECSKLLEDECDNEEAP